MSSVLSLRRLLVPAEGALSYSAAMEFQDYMSELARLERDGASVDPDWKLRDELWRQLTQKAEAALTAIAPGAFCTAQDWDKRIDCQARLSDGRIVGEMISLSDLSETRLKATGDRLRRRVAGDNVPLVNELRGPIGIWTP